MLELKECCQVPFPEKLSEGYEVTERAIYANVNDDLIRIQRPNGETLTLPPDLRSTKRARPGEYTLHSTGETVKDPDFLVTWNVTSPQND